MSRNVPISHFQMAKIMTRKNMEAKDHRGITHKGNTETQARRRVCEATRGAFEGTIHMPNYKQPSFENRRPPV